MTESRQLTLKEAASLSESLSRAGHIGANPNVIIFAGPPSDADLANIFIGDLSPAKDWKQRQYKRPRGKKGKR